jgi:ketosteroid isomerase-like protein
VERAWSTYLAGDLDGFLDQHHADVEIQPLTRRPTESVEPRYRGHAGVRRCVEDCAQSWEIFPGELQTFGENVLTLGRLVEKGGRGETYAAAWVHRIEDGKIASLRAYLEPGDALKDLQADALD